MFYLRLIFLVCVSAEHVTDNAKKCKMNDFRYILTFARGALLLVALFVVPFRFQTALADDKNPASVAAAIGGAGEFRSVHILVSGNIKAAKLTNGMDLTISNPNTIKLLIQWCSAQKVHLTKFRYNGHPPISSTVFAIRMKFIRADNTSKLVTIFGTTIILVDDDYNFQADDEFDMTTFPPLKSR
jgi:hypothetical protein